MSLRDVSGTEAVPGRVDDSNRLRRAVNPNQLLVQYANRADVNGSRGSGHPESDQGRWRRAVAGVAPRVALDQGCTVMIDVLGPV